MARKDFGKRERGVDRYGRSSEQYWNREDDEDMGEGREGRRREFQEQNREFGSERDREHRQGFQDWRREGQQGRVYGMGGSGGEQWGERRYGGGYQDTEDRERYQGGYADRGWETSGMGEPRTFGEGSYRRSGGTFGGSGTYGGSSMYGGGYGAGMMEQSDWRRDQYGGARQRGRFFGRGPKGYRRADDKIREDVNERLFRHHDVDASDVEIEVREGTVTLSGTVDSRETRRMAEDCVWDVTGVQHVTNQMRVEPGRHRGNGGEWQREMQGRTMQQGTQMKNKGKSR